MNWADRASVAQEVVAAVWSLVKSMDILQVVLYPLVGKYLYGLLMSARKHVNDRLYTQIRFRDRASIDTMRGYFKHRSTDRYNDMEVMCEDSSMAGEAEILNEQSEESSTSYDVRVDGVAPVAVTHMPVLGCSEYFLDTSQPLYRLPFLWCARRVEMFPIASPHAAPP